jgi:alpha-glucosidase
MHLFYPEQPALNFHNPDVEAAIGAEMQFWFDRGVDGLRLDAVQFLYTDPELRDWQPIGDKVSTEVDPSISVWDCTPDAMLDLTGQWLQRLRTRHPDKYFVTEANVAIDRLKPFTSNANASFCFEFLKYAQPELAVIEPLLQAATQDPGIAWCIGNHDVGRLISRWGDKYARAAATLVCTLPGSAFIYMGDEIGMTNGPGTTPPIDRYGRDAVRHPMQWHPDGGFTTGTPWLPMHNPADVNVAVQADESSSLLNWYRHLLQLRREFVSEPLVWGNCDNNVLRYSRGRFEVAIDFTSGDVSVS